MTTNGYWKQPGHEVRSLGRTIIDHNEANRLYPTRGTAYDPSIPLGDKVHRRIGAMDQGSTSQCVAYTGKGMLNTAPFSNVVAYDIREDYDEAQWYRWAQNRDEWPGREPDYYGTSARGLCRGLRRHGVINSFRWCFGIDDVLHTLHQWGPVGIGGNWLTGMDAVSEEGVVSYSGEVRGGHEWEAFGLDVSSEQVVAMNSWGETWGDRGRFYISFSDLDLLLQDGGDAFTFGDVVHQP